MRSKSQKLMNEISAYFDQYYSERHTAPSVNEIAKGVGIAKTTSYRYLVAMNDLGMLRYDGASRTIMTRMISKFSESSVPAPVVGAIPCILLPACHRHFLSQAAGIQDERPFRSDTA